MPQNGLIYRILIASPSDCSEEREAIPDIIRKWNISNSLSKAAILEPVKWETHAYPEMGDRAQAIVNKQIVDNCDILVGTFWTRIGSPTGKSVSGTVEEIEEFIAAGKLVLLYFSSVPIIPESIDRDQYGALVGYREQLEKEGRGLVARYDSLENFREQFQTHLATLMEKQLEGHPPGPVQVASSISKELTDLNDLKDRFGIFLRRLQAEWVSERDSEPYSIDEGQAILSRALGYVLNFRGAVAADGQETLSSSLDQIAIKLREIKRHELYLDGGTSFRAFWKKGDEIIEMLKQVSDEIDSEIAKLHSKTE